MRGRSEPRGQPRFARGERDAASPALPGLSAAKIAGFKEGRSHPGTQDCCKLGDPLQEEGNSGSKPPQAVPEAPGAFTYPLVPELLSLWGGRRSSLCRPGGGPCFPTGPKAAKTTPNVLGGVPAASPSSLSGCQEGRGAPQGQRGAPRSCFRLAPPHQTPFPLGFCVSRGLTPLPGGLHPQRGVSGG